MRDPNLLYQTKVVLKHLINNGPDFQTVNSIYADFYNYTQSHIPFFELGYSFLEKFLQSIPDVLQVDTVTLQVRPAATFPRYISPNRSQVMLAPIKFPLVSYRQEMNETHSTISLPPRIPGVGRSSSSDSIPTDIERESHEQYKQNLSVSKAFVETLMTKNDKNVGKRVVRFDGTIDEFQFEEETKWNLNDASGMLQESLSTSLSDTIIVKFDDTPPPPYSVVKLFDNKDYRLSSTKEKDFVSSDDDDDDEKDDAIPFMFDDKINMLSSSFFNGKFGSTFVTTNIEDLVTVGNVYELYVSEVNSPFKFWFQLNEETPNPVEELQEHLNDCYNMTDLIPELIKPEHMKKGYACAALYARMWHRGEIIGQVENGKVSIFFVDYGTVDQVHIGDVRYLLNSFCSWPKLCHRGTLDFIKPRNPSHRWTVEATAFLINLVVDRKLTAGITEIDRKNNSVRLYLNDTSADIKVNRLLVSEGYAYPDDPRERYQRHIADVAPSFDDLETGQHASFSKVVTLLEQDYDYEELLHTSVIEEFDCYIPSFVSEEEATERMETFLAKKEEGQKLAKKRDAKLFLEIFKNISTNPFLNGTMTDEIAVDATNPFLD